MKVLEIQGDFATWGTDMQTMEVTTEDRTSEERSHHSSDRFVPAHGFEECAVPLFSSLLNFARWITRNPHDAEDLVQETYLKAQRGFGSFHAGSSLQAWMFTILKHTYLNSRCKLERRMTVQLESNEDWSELAIDYATPHTILAQSSRTERLLRAVEQMPRNSREVLLLSDVEEMSYREIAEQLSIPIGTVMSRLSRARRMLRACYTETGAGDHPSATSLRLLPSD